MDLVEIASQLRYESYNKDIILNDQGSNLFLSYNVEDYEDKFWIILSGQVSV